MSKPQARVQEFLDVLTSLLEVSPTKIGDVKEVAMMLAPSVPLVIRWEEKINMLTFIVQLHDSLGDKPEARKDKLLKLNTMPGVFGGGAFGVLDSGQIVLVHSVPIDVVNGDYARLIPNYFLKAAVAWGNFEENIAKIQ